MSRLAEIAGRAKARLRRRLSRAGPPDLAPVAGGQGSVPFVRGSLPAFSGALLPLGEQARLAFEDPGAAAVQSLAWSASAGLDRADPWDDPAAVAGRLLHLAVIAALAGRGLTAADQQALAGLGRAHGVVLRRRALEEPCAAALAAAALAAASLAWPALGEGSALKQLSPALSATLGADGAPLGDLPATARALWAAALVRAWRAEALAPDGALDGALLAGADALWRLGGDSGALPGPGRVDPAPPALLPLGPAPLAHSLRNLVVGWGLDPGPMASAQDPAVVRLGGRPGPAAPSMRPKGWALWAWRSTGLAVAHSAAGGGSRLLLDARDGRLRWDLAEGLCVQGAWDEAGGGLSVARVDGRKLRLSAARADAARELRGQGARLVVLDRGPAALRWRLSAGLELAPTADGFAGAWRQQRLEVKLDPAWSWRLRDGEILGQGPPGAVSSSFELRG